MATHHGGAGQPSDRDPNLPEQDTDIPSDHLEDMDNFENVEHESNTTLKALTRNLDDLWHRVENAEGQHMEAILYITWNVSFTDYHSHFNPQHPQNHWMKYYNNTQGPYVLPRNKPLLQTLLSKIYPPSMGVIQHNYKIG